MEQIESLQTSRKFKKTEIGEIPVDWEIVRLGEVADIGAGNSAPQEAKYFQNGKYPYVRTSDVGRVQRSHCFNMAEDKINDLAVKELGLRLWPAGTILFPKSGASTFLNHRVLLAVPAYVSSHFATILARSNTTPEFLYYVLTTVDAKSLVRGKTNSSLRLNDIGAIQIPLPPVPEQKKISEILTDVDKTIEKDDEIIGKTKQLKQGLMQMLLTGKVRVKV